MAKTVNGNLSLIKVGNCNQREIAKEASNVPTFPIEPVLHFNIRPPSRSHFMTSKYSDSFLGSVGWQKQSLCKEVFRQRHCYESVCRSELIDKGSIAPFTNYDNNIDNIVEQGKSFYGYGQKDVFIWQWACGTFERHQH